MFKLRPRTPNHHAVTLGKKKKLIRTDGNTEQGRLVFGKSVRTGVNIPTVQESLPVEHLNEKVKVCAQKEEDQK